MSNSNSLIERGAEWRATAEAAMIVKILTEAANEPSTKRFVKGRNARIERWEQLAECASRQVNGLQALARTIPKRAKARTNVPIAAAHIDSETARLVTADTQQSA